MKFLSKVAIVFLCVSFLCSCGLNSDSKLYTAKGDSALNNGDYSSALEFYRQAVDAGKANDKTVALTAVLDAYLSAKEAYDQGDIKTAEEIIDDLEYDYMGYAIEEDMRKLIDDISESSASKAMINRQLERLEEAVDDDDFDYAYELISELEGKDFDEEQAEEFEHQCQRLEKRESKKPNKPKKQTTEKPSSVEVNRNPQPEEKPSSADGYYRVRSSWENAQSQIGAFTSYDNAVKAANENPGTKVYDSTGKVLYP